MENAGTQDRTDAEEEISLRAGSAEDADPVQNGAEMVESLRKERDENYELLLRKQAEFENYRKRVNREKEELRLSARSEVLAELLPVLDALEKGLGSLQEEREERRADELDSYLEGYQLMLRELRGVLERFEVSEVPGPGSAFDPNLHEAVIREVTGEHEDGTILEEFRKGYRIRERLLRAAQVKVAVEPEENSEE